jgi:hypothetical protein
VQQQQLKLNKSALRLPNKFVINHLPEVVNTGEEYHFAVQVVLLPHHAADITPDTPAQEILAHDAHVKKTETKGSGSLATTKWSVSVSGLTKVLPSKLFQEEWWCRGEQETCPNPNRRTGCFWLPGKPGLPRPLSMNLQHPLSALALHGGHMSTPQQPTTLLVGTRHVLMMEETCFHCCPYIALLLLHCVCRIPQARALPPSDLAEP